MALGDFMKRARAPPKCRPAGVPESETIAAGSRMWPPPIRRVHWADSAGNADPVGDDQPETLADAPSEVRIHPLPEGDRRSRMVRSTPPPRCATRLVTKQWLFDA